jgi:hypothetical protein
MQLIKAIALGGLLLLALFAVLVPGPFPGPPGFLTHPTPVSAPSSPEAPPVQGVAASVAGERPVSQGKGAGQVQINPARRWYVHIASAFPLAHHYRAVLAWGS